MTAGISQTGTVCRSSLSATGFDVLGNSTKYATLFFSVVVFGSSVPATSLLGVLVALTGGVIYSSALPSWLCPSGTDL